MQRRLFILLVTIRIHSWSRCLRREFFLENIWQKEVRTMTAKSLTLLFWVHSVFQTMYFKIVFVITIINKEDFNITDEESSVLHFSLLQKQRKISTSTDFLPAITWTACNSRLQPSSKANCASAHPRNTGTKHPQNMIIL